MEQTVFLLSASEATLRLGEGRRGFQAAVRTGAIRPRATGTHCYWPEEVDLAAISHRAVASSVAPLLALAQGLAPRETAADIAETTARHVHLLTRANVFGLYILAGDRSQMRRVPRRGQPASAHDVVIHREEVPIWDEVLAGRQPLLVTDAASDPRFTPELVARFALSSLIVVPMIAGGEVTGVLTVEDWPEGAEPDPAHLPVLEGMANLVAVALARVAQAEHEQRRLRHAVALNAIAADLAGTADPEVVLPLVASRSAAALPAARIGVYVYDETGEQIVNWHRRDDEGDAVGGGGDMLPPAQVPAERAMLAGQPVNDPALLRASSGDPHAHAVLAPLSADGKVLGALWAFRPAAEPPFDAADAMLLAAIGRHGGAALARARIVAAARAAQARAEHQIAAMELILATNRRLVVPGDREAPLAAVGDGIARLLSTSACVIYHLTPTGHELRRVYASSLGSTNDAAERLPVEGSLLGAIVRERQPLCLPHAQRDPRTSLEAFDPTVRRFIARHGLHLIAAPLVVDEAPLGVLVALRVGGDPFAEEDLDTVRLFADQAAIAIHAAETFSGTRQLYLACLRALASAIDAKDPTTRGHSSRVGQIARRIATGLGLECGTIETIELAALLHDIGKVGVPDGILLKPGRLDDAERAVMMGHAALGARILAEVGDGALAPLVPLVRHHHEWDDGTGYPDHLRGEQIPLGAAIIALADAYDTMTTDRGYRAARSPAAAIADLRAASGTQFRPQLVAVLADLVAGDPAVPLTPSPPRTVAAPRLAFPVPDATTPATHAPVTAGQIGDTRALGLLVELGSMTRHIPDLPEFLQHVTEMIRRRLGYEDVMLMLVDHERNELAIAAHSGNHPREAILSYRQSLDTGICGDVVRTGRPRNAIDVTTEPDFHATWREPHGSALVIPLTIDDKTIGVINVEADRIAAFSAADQEVLTAAAGQVAAAVHVAQLHDALKRMAMTDGLTGLANHRAFYEALDEATAGEARLSVILLDVEGLKIVNDSAGHLAGDALLRRVAAVVRGSVRARDLVARYGGDEFAIILRGVGPREANLLAADIRDRLTADERDVSRTTVRYGVASLPADGRRSIELVDAADRRLYHMRAAQAEGR